MSDVKDDNCIPIDKDKLKDEKKAELKAATDAYGKQCLLSFSTKRNGEVIKKFDFPTLPPYNEAQKEDRMAHMVNHAIGQAFISHASIMANSVHNAVVKMLQEGRDENGRERSGKHSNHSRYCIFNLGMEAGTGKPIGKMKSVTRYIKSETFRSGICR